jgi:hypothetical protein
MYNSKISVRNVDAHLPTPQNLLLVDSQGKNLQTATTAAPSNGQSADNLFWKAHDPYFSEIYVCKSPQGGDGFDIWPMDYNALGVRAEVISNMLVITSARTPVSLINSRQSEVRTTKTWSTSSTPSLQITLPQSTTTNAPTQHTSATHISTIVTPRPRILLSDWLICHGMIFVMSHPEYHPANFKFEI